jgi:nucleoside-diphosphate-sugar epimerase
MNIFVTGSNGFLGTYFRKNNNMPNCNIIYGSTSDNNFALKFNNLYSDILEKLNNKRIDVIIHFASVIPKSFQSANFKNTYLPNIKMMNNLYSYSVSNKIKKFIYISSFGSMKEPDKLDIHDFYTMSKIAGEHFCSIMETNGIQTASLRLSAPYGEYSRTKNVINLFIEKAIKNDDIEIFGSGKREQNFIYAQDIVKAIEICVEKDVSGIYDIVSEHNISMLNLAEIILKLTNSESKIIFNGQPDPQEGYKPKYTYGRAFKKIGFKPQYDIERGLNKYINWLLANQ